MRTDYRIILGGKIIIKNEVEMYQQETIGMCGFTIRKCPMG